MTAFKKCACGNVLWDPASVESGLCSVCRDRAAHAEARHPKPAPAPQPVAAATVAPVKRSPVRYMVRYTVVAPKPYVGTRCCSCGGELPEFWRDAPAGTVRCESCAKAAA